MVNELGLTRVPCDSADGLPITAEQVKKINKELIGLPPIAGVRRMVVLVLDDDKTSLWADAEHEMPEVHPAIREEIKRIIVLGAQTLSAGPEGLGGMNYEELRKMALSLFGKIEDTERVIGKGKIKTVAQLIDHLERRTPEGLEHLTILRKAYATIGGKLGAEKGGEGEIATKVEDVMRVVFQES